MPEVNGIQDMDAELWPCEFLEVQSEDADLDHKKGDTALIILNSPIEDFNFLHRLWSHASFHLCADGAANRLHNVLTKQYPKADWQDTLRILLPEVIHGDLDSIDDLIRERYDHLGVVISKDPDQYSTDFGKAVHKVNERLPNLREILVLGSIGGRVDQGIGLLGELYREQIIGHRDVRFWLFSEASVSTILSPGVSVIHTPLSKNLISRNTGILPVYGPAKISTQGLEWDIEDWPTEMGGQMSTSNHIVSDIIKISTNNHVLFTVERAAKC